MADAESTPNPVLLGADMAGSYHINHNLAFWTREPFYEALDDLGIKYLSITLYPADIVPFVAEDQQRYLGAMEMKNKIFAIDAGMRAHGVKYTISNEFASYYTRLEATPGVNEFESSPGLHRWDLRMDWLNPILPPAKPGAPALVGMAYDEWEHMQQESNRYANNMVPPQKGYIPANSFDVPYLANVHGLGLEVAFDRLVEAAREVRLTHYEGRVPTLGVQVMPDMFHVIARAGWGVSPKLLKENLSSVILSIALGAALEYQDRSDMQVTVDMWGFKGFPGHSLEALHSALAMGYWTGAGTIFIENLDYDGSSERHPDATIPGGLIHWLDTDHYELTPHGAVAKDFYKTYVPAHPRTIRWQDYRPRVAIVRLPDGDWGLNDKAFYFPFRDRLLGNKDIPSDTASREWLHVWPLLTHGAAHDGAISIFNWTVYPNGELNDFFIPIDSVAMFDHLVEGPVLDSVQCFVVCGHALSPQTFVAIRDRVATGATCIIARRLYNQWCSGPLPGKWVIVDDFTSPEVAKAIEPFTGPPDVARFRFKDQVVEFHKGVKKDSVTVEILDRPTFEQIERLRDALLGKIPTPPDADANGDGRFDIGDIIFLMKTLHL